MIQFFQITDYSFVFYSLVVTIGFVIIGGYVMHYLVKMEEESVRKQLGAKVHTNFKSIYFTYYYDHTYFGH